MLEILRRAAGPAILIRHDCCSEGSYPSRGEWVEAFQQAGTALTYVIDLPRLQSSFGGFKIEVFAREEDGLYSLVEEVDARPEVEDDAINPVAFGRGFKIAKSLINCQPAAYDIFVIVCHPRFLVSGNGVMEREMATSLADDGHRLYALISCQSEHIAFGQALACSGGYELFRTTAIDGPVARLSAKRSGPKVG